MYAIFSGTMTLYCGLIFIVEPQLNGFYQFLVVLLFLVNAVFLIKWFYLFLHSLNIKNGQFKKFMDIYAILVRDKRNRYTEPTTEGKTEGSSKNIRAERKAHKKLILGRKRTIRTKKTKVKNKGNKYFGKLNDHLENDTPNEAFRIGKTNILFL